MGHHFIFGQAVNIPYMSDNSEDGVAYVRNVLSSAKLVMAPKACSNSPCYAVHCIILRTNMCTR